MFNFFKNWKARQKANRFAEGKALAKAEIMQHGDAAIEELEDHVECMHIFGDYDEFEEGIEEALRDYRGSGEGRA